MKRVKLLSIYPLNKGLDTTSIAGVRDVRALKKAKNVILRQTPSLRKRPGTRRIPYVGNDGGIQAVTHFFATVGGGQVDEVIRARNGRLEALRPGSGSDKHFVDLGIAFSPTDTVTFERFGNALLIFFENTPPYYYLIGGIPLLIPILVTHLLSPPSFARVHDFRLWYGGRPADPHKLWVSGINTFYDFTLATGGFSLRVKDGDGDPIGLTGVSATFRGDIFAYKWNSVYRIYVGSYGYSIAPVTDQVGCVHHNTIVTTQNDVYSVGMDAIHSLVITDKYGAAEEHTLTYPIYEWFQENVNWDNATKMIMTLDKPSNTLLLSYTSSSSSASDSVLGVNLSTKEFFKWEDIEYPSMGTYFDFGRQTTFVADNLRGISILDKNENTLNGSPISLEIETGAVFPSGNAKDRVNYLKGWIVAKPTLKDVLIDVSYYINGEYKESHLLNLYGGGEGSTIAADELVTTYGDEIDANLIGKMKEDMVILPFDMAGEGNAVIFNIKHTPPVKDPDQPVEIYGILYEVEYDEDTEKKESI